MEYKPLDFREELGKESDSPLDDHLFKLIVDNSRLLEYSKGEAIVDFGEIDQDLYIIREGIVRGYMHGQYDEVNIFFGMTGTLLCSMHGFSLGEPSKIRIEACCPTQVIKMTKATTESLMKDHNDFCLWMAGVFSRRCLFTEIKAHVMNGDASWRYRWLEKCRPELFENVPLKVIASYLNMTEVHISRVRSRILKDQTGKSTKHRQCRQT